MKDSESSKSHWWVLKKVREKLFNYNEQSEEAISLHKSRKRMYQMKREKEINLLQQKKLTKLIKREKETARINALQVQLLQYKLDLENLEDKLEQQRRNERLEKKKLQVDNIFNINNSDEEKMYEQAITHYISNKSDNDMFIINPTSTFKTTWELVGLFMILYQAISIPYRICFEQEAQGFSLLFESIIDVCFILDIVIQFNSGFFKKGQLVLKRVDIAKNYVTSWFIIDVMASFPYDWVISQFLSTEDTAALMTPKLMRLVKLTRFLRFLRLLRVLKLKELIQRLEETIINEQFVAFLNLMKVVIVVAFIGHWMACLFFQIGSLETEFGDTSWQLNIDLTDREIDEKYITSLYWSFTTMTTTGYGDIYPVTNMEKLFVIVCMLVSCGVFAYVVGSIETIVRSSGVIEEFYKEKIIHINQFLILQNIPKPIILQVRKYLQELSSHKKQ